ncbi:MAG: hypothetical protein ACSW8K_04935, partial [bacterium]
DTDGTVYTIHEPLSCMTDLLEDLEEPNVTLDSVSWYQTVDHVEVIYEIDPGDAEDITSQATINYDLTWDQLAYTLPGVDGSGVIRAEGNANGSLQMFSSGEWSTTVVLKYMLGGEEWEQEFIFPGSPDVFFTVMDAAETYISGTTPEDVNLGCELDVKYRKDDRHDYTFSFSKADLEYYFVDSYGNDISCGGKLLWTKDDGTPSPFYGPESPSGPDSSGHMTLSYSYWQEGLDITPEDARATRCKLHFYAEVEGDDSYDGTGELYCYTDIFDIPGATVQEAPKAGTAGIYWWPDLSHFRLTYDIEPADATDITSSVKLYLDRNDTFEEMDFPGQAGSGTIQVDRKLSDAEAAAMDPSAIVEVDVYLEYRMNGRKKTISYSIPYSAGSYTCSLTGGDYSVSAGTEITDVVYNLALNKTDGDPHNYSARFSEVSVLWYEPGNNNPVGETVILNGTFSGSGTAYKYEGSFSTSPSSSAVNSFALRFKARIYGNDSFDQESGFERIHTTDKFNLPAGS